MIYMLIKWALAILMGFILYKVTDMALSTIIGFLIIFVIFEGIETLQGYFYRLKIEKLVRILYKKT